MLNWIYVYVSLSHHLLLQQLSLAAIENKNCTRLIQPPPPHHGAYSSILEAELVSEWKNDGYLRLYDTFGGVIKNVVDWNPDFGRVIISRLINNSYI